MKTKQTAAEADLLPLEETVEPADQAALVEAVRGAAAARRPVYPIGGGTSLDFGLPAKQPGVGLVLRELHRVVDYPARDMTITVEAGMTLAALNQALAAEGQQLPLDVPQAERATLGGVIATNSSGPRRYGYGTIRDYVIGISAVDGRGRPFKGGGRVVKNVAGYDFCKLLTGSLGTLGVISQVTLKVKPLPQASALLACPVASPADAEPLLAALVQSATTPCAIELLVGPAWREGAPLPLGEGDALLVVGLEGTEPEVAWMIDTLRQQWRRQGVGQMETLTGHPAAELWRRLAEFPAEGDAPLVLKAAVRPSRVAEICRLLLEIDPQCSLQAHAGSGVVIARLPGFSFSDVSRILVGRLQSAAASAGGSLVVLRSRLDGELTRQAVWGGRGLRVDVMEAVRNQFDPDRLLNPGRFVY